MEEEVRSVLIDGKVLLQFALASIIEALRRNLGKYNNLLVGNTESSTSTPAQDLLLSHIEDYKDMILDESKRLYERLLIHLTNSIIDNTVGDSSLSNSSWLPSSTFNFGPFYENASYEIEEPEIIIRA